MTNHLMNFYWNGLFVQNFYTVMMMHSNKKNHLDFFGTLYQSVYFISVIICAFKLVEPFMDLGSCVGLCFSNREELFHSFLSLPTSFLHSPSPSTLESLIQLWSHLPSSQKAWILRTSSGPFCYLSYLRSLLF